MKVYRLTDPTGASVEVLPEKGATVISYQVDGKEYFYRDPENLGSSERPRCGIPFLFPCFGRTPEGSAYPMEIHGFGHTSRWDVISCQEDSLRLALRENPDTLKVFPFRFRVELTFALRQGRLHIHQRYENTGSEPMPCTRESVTVTFADGAMETGAFFLQASDFAIIDSGDKAIKMRFDSSFNRLVLWAVRGRPFLCVEPINSSPNGLVTGDCYHLAPGEYREAEISFEVM